MTPEDVPHAAGRPACRARIRVTPGDFQVDELLGFEPCGEGPHAFVRVRKTGHNSHEVARRLARLAGVRVRDVGLAGLKDRDAVTTQWFSVPLNAAPDPDWRALEAPGLEVLESARHRRKLRRGAHRGNAFRLVLRDIEGPPGDLAARVSRAAAGVPNYFGPQRFGHDGSNLEHARQLLAGEIRVRDARRRGLYLSAARAWLFNRVLARRVTGGTWDGPVEGDVMNLDGRTAVFALEGVDPDTLARAAAGEIHPTGPLWGRGGMRAAAVAAALEGEALADQGWWCAALERFGLDMDRRALRVRVQDLGLDLDPEGCPVVTFRLRRGAYATTVLRELVNVA